MRRMPATEIQAWLADHDPVPIVPLVDDVVEALGHDPRGRYAETHWLPVIGPSALWALRRLTVWLEATPAGFPLPLGLLGREIGLGDGTGRSSPLIRTVGRLVLFDLAEIRGDELAVRRVLPPLARRHLLRLPTHLVSRHDAEVASHRPRPTPDPAPAGAPVTEARR